MLKETAEEYDDISDLQYLAVWGRKAEDSARELLEGKQVVIQTDERACLRDVYGRLLAYIYIDGKDFGCDNDSRGICKILLRG
ncbi:hypothetical protein Asulf_01382 [Archaeoglobus sulfaticallidus PM70-1]|uniref:TNase-like domain-containing protein n=1 Tax=Archaeoglobus sulfaticallidus PM70-1 TaxID=387631 RepID=N0BED0_9EURY|nr:thermonuclease family protein [Archaeoglobus sulfaticallidus]AGK61373.1 hypothetical protein Asulf_01382 [Archaeoglobus sulfaticallidus PM70-1]